MTYFSDRELGQKPRTEQEISQTVWEAIVSEFDRLLNDHAFAKNYPEQCPDGNGVYTTDKKSLFRQLKAEIGFDYPLVHIRMQLEHLFASNLNSHSQES
ncbi:MAG TPA: hypothetical protein PLU46_09250 [Thiotrichales bacterium]|nr:hypothetical protein [Thiotrichales bacterium]